MDDATARKLVDINRTFYQRFADPFDRTRRAPQPGYFRLLDLLPDRPLAVLDVGCGNGRFGVFLAENRRLAGYIGLDFNRKLLDLAAAALAARNGRSDFHLAEMSRPEEWPSLPMVDLVACISALQHVPQEERRRRIMIRMAAQLRPAGRLLLVNWQFLASERQRAKLLPWSTAGIDEDDVESGDYLLSWRRGGQGQRYVNAIDEAATLRLAAAANLRLLRQFRADGREGNLNLYSLFGRGEETRPGADTA